LIVCQVVDCFCLVAGFGLKSLGGQMLLLLLLILLSRESCLRLMGSSLGLDAHLVHFSLVLCLLRFDDFFALGFVLVLRLSDDAAADQNLMLLLLLL
jgi:hypothetical protein